MRDLFYIVGGIAGGWLIARKIFGPDSSYRRNPEYSLNWLDDEGEPSKFESDVLVGDQVVGSVVFLAPKKWAAYDEKLMPFGEFASSKAAANAVYNKWSEIVVSAPKPKTPTPMPEPTILKVKVPDWITDIEVEPTVFEGRERFIVWVGDDRAGIIERRGHNRYDAYVFTKQGLKQLEIGPSRKRAITAVYVSWKILEYLKKQLVRGKGASYSPKRWKTLPPKKRGQRPRRVEVLKYKRYYIQQSAYEMSKDLGIPEKKIILYGKKLAEHFLIYGMPGKEKKKSILKVEKTEREIPPYKHYPTRKRKRRIISHPDIEKLRKTGKISEEERKALPSIRQKTIYHFAMVGPQGEVGFGPKAWRRQG